MNDLSWTTLICFFKRPGRKSSRDNSQLFSWLDAKERKLNLWSLLIHEIVLQSFYLLLCLTNSFIWLPTMILPVRQSMKLFGSRPWPSQGGIATSFDFMNMEFNLVNLTYFLDIPSLLIIWVPSVFLSISATSWKSYWHSWSYPFLWRKQVGEDDANSAARCLKVKGDAGFVMGLIGTLIGAIIMIRDISVYAETQDLLNAVSVASITLFYGLLYKLFCYIAEQRVRNLYLNSWLN